MEKYRSKLHGSVFNAPVQSLVLHKLHIVFWQFILCAFTLGSSIVVINKYNVFRGGV